MNPFVHSRISLFPIIPVHRGKNEGRLGKFFKVIWLVRESNSGSGYTL